MKFQFRDTDQKRVEIDLSKGFDLSPERATTEGRSFTLTYAGHSIVLRERTRGTIEAEGDHGEGVPGSRRRTGYYLFRDAVGWAADRLHHVVRRAGVDVSAPTQAAAEATGGRTVSQASALAHERQVWGHCSLAQQAKYKLLLDIIHVLFGPDKLVSVHWSQSDVDLYFAARSGRNRRGELLSAEQLRAFGLAEAGIRFPRAYNRRDLPPVKTITVKNELKDISVLMGYLQTENIGNERFLTLNPLAGLDLGTGVRGTRADYHLERFRWVLAAADIVDSTGALRLMVVLAFLTAHRIDAILSLRLQHVAFTASAVRQLLRRVTRTHESEPVAQESWADYWPNGAIHWVAAHDKEGFDRVIPISPRVRTEIDRYLVKRAARLGAAQSEMLFPRQTDVSRPIAYDVSKTLLRQAEARARLGVAVHGLDVDEVLPATPGDAWHPARGWWERCHSNLFWSGDRNSAYVGGWTTNTGAVQSTVYGELHPQLMQACVDGVDRVTAYKDLGLLAEAQAALDPAEPSLDRPQERAA